MKKSIHPKWHHDCQVTCSCGHKFVIGSVFQTLEVDICHNCHPFFTGEVKFVDRQGRVDRFKRRLEAAKKAQATKPKKKQAQDDSKQDEPQSYRELLRQQQLELRKTAKQKTASN